MMRLLKICLSVLLLASCQQGLPDKPEGLSCTYFNSGDDSTTGFYCTGIRDQNQKVFFPLKDERINKAQCMPLDTFKKYTEYVDEIKKIAASRCN